MIKHTVEVLNVQNKQNSGIQFRLSGEQDACIFCYSSSVTFSHVTIYGFKCYVSKRKFLTIAHSARIQMKKQLPEIQVTLILGHIINFHGFCKTHRYKET